MWINALKYIFLMLMPFSLYSEKEKTVQIEWEKIPGAVSYRLEIKDSLDRTVYSGSTAATSASVSLSDGEFYRRIISVDKTGEEFSSEWTSVALISQKEKRSRIRLEWEKNAKADYYIAEVKNLEGKTVVRRTVRKTETDIDLPVGKYKKRIITADRTGESAAAEWTDLEVVKAGKENKKYDIIMRSAAFPGWGQVYSSSAYGFEKNRIRGYSVMTLSALLAGSCLFYVKQAETQKRNFSQYAANAVLLSAAAGDSAYSVADAYNMYVINRLAEKETFFEGSLKSANTALGILSFLYAVQLADAVRLQKYELPQISLQGGRTQGLFRESVFSVSAQFAF